MPNTKCHIQITEKSGKCLFAASGTKEGFPIIRKNLDVDCEYFGIKLEDLQSITDDRFDN